MKVGVDLFQSAFVVDDIDRAMEQWLANGVGPFYVIRTPSVEAFHYRGQPTDLHFSVAMAQAGQSQIELIAQHDDRPSHYRDSFGPGEGGFHHMCRFTDDIAADVAAYVAQGIAVAAQGRSGDMGFAYVDTRQQLGFMTEIIEDRPSIRQLFDMVRDAAHNWDGKDPIREVG